MSQNCNGTIAVFNKIAEKKINPIPTNQYPVIAQLPENILNSKNNSTNGSSKVYVISAKYRLLQNKNSIEITDDHKKNKNVCIKKNLAPYVVLKSLLLSVIRPPTLPIENIYNRIINSNNPKISKKKMKIIKFVTKNAQITHQKSQTTPRTTS
jgi:hypothetical protein